MNHFLSCFPPLKGEGKQGRKNTSNTIRVMYIFNGGGGEGTGNRDKQEMKRQ